jgi:hypothetical protein
MRTLFFILFLSTNFLATATSDSIEFCKETLNYFKKLVQINNENSGYIKWNSEIRVYFHELNRNNLTATNTVFESDYVELKNEFTQIINELNTWIEPINISFVNQAEETNFEVFVGSVNDCKLLDPSMRFTLAKNWGIQHSQLSFDGKDIVKSSVFIDLYRAPNLRIKKRLLRKKIAQALGFFHEIEDTKESVFYTGFSEQTNFTNLDKELIQLLYNKDLFENIELKTGIIDTPMNQVSVKVNLFADNATLTISQDLLNRDVILINSQGQQIQHFVVDSIETIISTSELQTGVYFLRLDTLPAVKIVKQ